jgi:phenylacetate-coenzyme A ligase PaaK-like adenylate-forming protein
MHLFESLTIVENVDDDGRPVPDGEPGSKMLITRLGNRTQPLIRLELSDAVTIDSEPCPCGRTLRRIRAINGRSDDVIQLTGRGGASVAVHPFVFAVVAQDREVVEYQVVQEGGRLQVLVVPRGDAPSLEPRLRTAVEQRLRDLGVADSAVEILRRPSLARQPGGKLQLVVADRKTA